MRSASPLLGFDVKKGWFARALRSWLPVIDHDLPAAVRRQVRLSAKQRQANAWAAAEKLAQCVIWSDEGQIQYTRPDGEQ